MLGVDIRDRTSEFFSITERLRSAYVPTSKPTAVSAAAASAGSSGGSLVSSKEFSKAASSIGMGIASTADRLERLAKLVKQKSLFNDPAREIEDMIYVIKRDLKALNGDLDQLADFVIKKKSSSAKQTDSFAENIVSTLKGDVASTTKQFAEILQERSKNLRAQSERKKEFSTTKRTARPRQALTLTPEEDLEGGSRPLLESGGMGMAMMESKDMSSDYLESRAAAVEQIEKTLQELAEMYQRLAQIVAVQNEMAVRIDAEMDSVVDNVKAGHESLLKTLEYVSSNRWLIIKVFLTIIICAIFFIVFVA